MVKLLIQMVANPNIKTPKGENSALYFASEMGNRNAALDLIQCGTTLMDLASNAKKIAMKKQFRYGFDSFGFVSISGTRVLFPSRKGETTKKEN